MNLYQKFNSVALKFSRKKAVCFGKKKLTYFQLKDNIENLASGFYYSLGIRRESKIAILLNNSSQYIISLFAAFRLGAVAVPLNIFLKSEELEYILCDCKPDGIITSAEFLPVLQPILQKVEFKVILVDVRESRFLSLGNLIEKRYNFAPCEEIGEQSAAVVCYTSSTTGRPKGVVLTHKNFISEMEGCCEIVDINYRDRILVFLPMFHTYTLTGCVFIPLLKGCAVYILPSFRNLASVVLLIFFRRITILVGIPRIFKMFSKVNIPKIFLIFSPVRLAISGADTLDTQIIEAFKKKFNINLIQGYGLTEASPVVCLNPPDRQKPGSVGLPLPNCELKIVDEKEEELPCNTEGELIVRGPIVMKEYFQLPQETQAALRGGWLFTGDIAKIDEEGYVYIVDRKKDMIITHGMNIYPKEVEEVMKGHPAVEEVAIVGKKDMKRGEVPVAFVVLKKDKRVQEGELIFFLKQRVADYKIPHLIEIREELPKTPTGKILKRVLREETGHFLLKG